MSSLQVYYCHRCLKLSSCWPFPLFPVQPLSSCSSAPPNHAFTPIPGHGGPQRAGITDLEREVKYSEGMMDEASVTRQDTLSTLPGDSQLSCPGLQEPECGARGLAAPVRHLKEPGG